MAAPATISLLKWLKELCADKRGVALVEFGFTAPILILMYLGSFQLCSALSAQRKVTTTARTITDLASQYQTVSDADLASILNASAQIMSPLNMQSGSAVVSQVSISDSGVATIAWSRGLNISARAVGSAIAIPASIRQPNTALILSEVRYQYQASGDSPILGSLSLHDEIMMAPRTVRSITKVS
jgi:Flp pilus assembly protein TadG